jgi:hypothetical protein
LADQLVELKRRGAETKARARALALEEKNLKKRRARLLQAGFASTRDVDSFVFVCVKSSVQAARQLSQDDLVLLLRAGRETRRFHNDTT